MLQTHELEPHVSGHHVDDRVRLTSDLPELLLHRGDPGVVRSIWFAPSCVYEVEFESDAEGGGCHTRALLLDEQISVDDHAIAGCGA